MLRKLPKPIAVCIALEIHSELLLQVPFLEPLMDKQPFLVQDLCLAIVKGTVPYNNFLFENGVEGIYWIKEGLVATEGVLFSSGAVIGLTCLRSITKDCECRALTDVSYHFLSKADLARILTNHPKAETYCKRWTIWQLVREYILSYTRLYYRAAKRGALMMPPLISRRPNLKPGEFDEIDLAVLDFISQHGY